MPALKLPLHHPVQMRHPQRQGHRENEGLAEHARRSRVIAALIGGIVGIAVARVKVLRAAIGSPARLLVKRDDLTGLALERVSQVPALCIDCTGMRSIGPDVLDGLDLRDRAVLFHTAHSATFGTEAYFQAHPFLSPATMATPVVTIVSQATRLVGS